MKRSLLFIALFVSLCTYAQIDKVVPPKPSSFYAVVDNTKTLTEEQVEALNLKLTRYKDSTTSEIAIVIIETLDGYPEEEVALQILRKWGVGSQKNNGVVILVAKNDRKIRIEVGYGLEGAIPDITAKSIIDNAITPEFRKENYYRGLDRAVDDLIKAAAGEYKAPQGSSASKRAKGIGAGAIIFFIIMVIVLSSLGGRGGGRGGMMSRRGYRDFGTGWILGSLLGGGGGSGGGWSGGGGGGGFGGFGGGSGGGGGASGSW